MKDVIFRVSIIIFSSFTLQAVIKELPETVQEREDRELAEQVGDVALIPEFNWQILASKLALLAPECVQMAQQYRQRQIAACIWGDDWERNKRPLEQQIEVLDLNDSGGYFNIYSYIRRAVFIARDTSDLATFLQCFLGYALLVSLHNKNNRFGTISAQDLRKGYVALMQAFRIYVKQQLNEEVPTIDVEQVDLLADSPVYHGNGGFKFLVDMLRHKFVQPGPVPQLVEYLEQNETAGYSNTARKLGVQL